MTQPRDPWRPVDSLGARLLLVRHQLGLTMQEAAEAVGVSRVTWRAWETGGSPRDAIAVVSRISEVFGVDREWLLWGDEHPDVQAVQDKARRQLKDAQDAREREPGRPKVNGYA